MVTENKSSAPAAVSAYLSLVIPCYNEEKTLKSCVERCMRLKEHGIRLELVIVDDCSTDKSYAVAQEIAGQHPNEITLCHHEVNQGKGAALRTGFTKAHGDFVGVQDADAEYEPLDYLVLLSTIIRNSADVVFGSRYLRQECRRVLYFWHTWMNRTLTFLSNMFTNLDISDMETCYKLFRRESIQKIAPLLRENRFGFEPEVTIQVARHKLRVYECAIHYEPRTYEDGKKIGWKDGLRALYCILHYGAPDAPLPMQLIQYFFIGLICALANLWLFSMLMLTGIPLAACTVTAFLLAAALNYVLCITILFRHKARWSSAGEILAYLLTITVMCGFDFGITAGLMSLGVSAFWSKSWSTFLGFFGNFILRKFLVF